jgi:hypothetical protein
MQAPQSAIRNLDFAELSEQFARRLIYVVGSARGGSTFANRVIGLHPSLLYVEWNDKTFSDIWPLIGTLSDEELRRRLFSPSKHSDVRISLEHLDPETRLKWDQHVEHALAERDLRGIVCLRGLFYWMSQAPHLCIGDISGWCIKANTWQGVDLLKRAIPEARLVFVLRDPRSTSLSFAKVYARRRQEFFADHDLLRGSFDWLRNATEFAIRLSRYNDAHIVYFEQLISEPVTTLNKLYQELGLDPIKPAMLRGLLDSIEYSHTKTHTEQGKPRTLTGVQAIALDRWRRELSDEQLRRICAIARAGARHFGYELEYAPSLMSLLRGLSYAKERSAAEYLMLYLYCRARLATC